MKVARNDGFTFIEMLLVLTAITVLMAVSFPSLNSVAKQKTEMYIITQLRNDLLYAQQYAMTHKTSVAVTFSENHPEYRITEITSEKTILKRSIPSEWKFQLTTLTMPLIFLENGNINKAGSLLLKRKDRTYKIVFLLGKGRFYVQKL
ncbi:MULTISPECIES: competence type IV pilus minor pilin ComGD [Bacillaceae]|uniref:competence type IV pilus minor pilin ComGD n=1 Tax=Anoxybacillaceae TaxID=3120669 RepID=UPI00078971F1|nr:MULTISPECIES: competence type IV pilus minor pilin ComGD [Bacillaceae]PDM41324.1 competence protein ComG [Parageobacillus yumthangensis]TXK91842.1 prepilin-type N-terminal cleavage/methylation domain-containing protein [Parageobacillus sp. SY1]PUF89793.1 prepilin-type N-terminal cleavage/methylation domain-containing protein [Geobacillus sp. LYN3]RDV21837.1 prepilin-type N-terminal cleavage/methylation domain-containing protein [Parageobacillus toebii]TXK86608.1 prepilin-type N-terminal cle